MQVAGVLLLLITVLAAIGPNVAFVAITIGEGVPIQWKSLAMYAMASLKSFASTVIVPKVARASAALIMPVTASYSAVPLIADALTDALTRSDVYTRARSPTAAATAAHAERQLRLSALFCLRMGIATALSALVFIIAPICGGSTFLEQ